MRTIICQMQKIQQYAVCQTHCSNIQKNTIVFPYFTVYDTALGQHYEIKT
jgi:hypothetical protein